MLKMHKLLALAVLCLLVSGELLLVQEVFRHGARYPIYPSQIDGSFYAIQENKVGELTTQGKRMHYLLGQQLYKQYWSALGFNKGLNTSKIYVKSTNINRTIESVQSQLAGWTENLDPLMLSIEEAVFSMPAWNQNIDSPSGNVYISSPTYQPVPIHTELGGSNPLNHGDFLYYFTYDNCPKMKEWEAYNKQNSQIRKQILEEPRVQAAILAVQIALGLDQPPTMDRIQQFMDNYYCTKNLGKPVNPIFDDYSEFRKELDLLRLEDLYINAFETDLQVNATITPFMMATRKNMRSIMGDRTREKLILYSAHDMTVANVLTGFRMTSPGCVYDVYKNKSTASVCISEYPRFAANLIFELHYNNDAYSVRLRYGGDYYPMPFCNNKLECPYDDFQRFMNQTIRTNYLEDCGVLADTSPRFPTALVVSTSIIGTLFLGASVYAYVLFRKKKDLEAYNQQTEQPEE